MSVRDLVIVGVGGMAREAHELVEDINAERQTWNALGFLDDDPDLEGTSVHELPVLGGREWLLDHPDVSLVLGIGKSADRRAFDRWVDMKSGNEIASLVHPFADIGRRVEIGPGSIICPGVVITTDVRIGRGVIVNIATTLSHDDVVDDHVTIAPGAHVAGTVHLEEGADLGIGCTINQGLTVGRWSIVGAGAAVIRDVPPNATVVGVPAREIKRRPEGWHEVEP
jgi:sugar O-acyltransferase (sialic acid O-acetyltransferase NeuD family)